MLAQGNALGLKDFLIDAPYRGAGIRTLTCASRRMRKKASGAPRPSPAKAAGEGRYQEGRKRFWFMLTQGVALG